MATNYSIWNHDASSAMRSLAQAILSGRPIEHMNTGISPETIAYMRSEAERYLPSQEGTGKRRINNEQLAAYADMLGDRAYYNSIRPTLGEDGSVYIQTDTSNVTQRQDKLSDLRNELGGNFYNKFSLADLDAFYNRPLQYREQDRGGSGIAGTVQPGKPLVAKADGTGGLGNANAQSMYGYFSDPGVRDPGNRGFSTLWSSRHFVDNNLPSIIGQYYLQDGADSEPTAHNLSQEDMNAMWGTIAGNYLDQSNGFLSKYVAPILKVGVPLAIGAIGNNALGLALGGGAGLSAPVSNAVKSAASSAVSSGINGDFSPTKTLLNAALAGGASYLNAPTGSLFGDAAGTTLDKATGIVGMQGPTAGTGITGAITRFTNPITSAFSNFTGSSLGDDSMNLKNILGGIGDNILAKRTEDKAKDEMMKYLEANQAMYSPYLQAGENALNQLTGNLQAGYSYDDLVNDPGYQFQMNEGMKAIDRSQAARGGLYSGAALKEALGFSQGLADQTFNDGFNRWSSQNQQLQGVANTGQQAAGAVAANNNNIANVRANSAVTRGNIDAQLLARILGGNNLFGSIF